MIHIIRRLIYIESKTQAHYDHLVYCNFYAIFAFIYSCLIMPSIYLELRDLISNIDSGTKSKSMDFISSNLDDMIKTNSTTLEYDINIPSDFAASISPMVSNVSYDFCEPFCWGDIGARSFVHAKTFSSILVSCYIYYIYPRHMFPQTRVTAL